MMRRTRSLRAVGILAAASLALGAAACGSSGDGGGIDGGGGGGDSYDLTFWIYSDFIQGASRQVLDGFIDEMKAEHDNLGEINLIAKNDAELLNGVMAGVGLPDAFTASARDSRNYKNIVDLLDLSPVFDDSYSAGFYPNALDAVSVDGGVWAIPHISYIPIIYRNLDALEAAGIDPADGTPTYDVFIDQLAEVESAGLSATHSWTNNGYFAPGAVMASDAESITYGNEGGQTTVKPEQLVRTFETIQRIEEHANQSLTNDGDVTMEQFKSGQLAFMIGGPWHEEGIKQAGTNYDFVLVPAYEEGGWTGGLQGWDFFYGVDSGDDARNELVRAFLAKVGSFEGQKAWTLATGRPTLRQDVMDDPEVVASSAMAQVSSEGLAHGMMQMEFMHSSVFWPSAIADSVAALGQGSLTPDQAADQFVTAINALYSEASE